MKRSLWAALLFVCLWAGAAPRAATYYVALDGDQANDGSQGAPWPSLWYALRQIQGGDTVIVGDGEYHGYVSCSRVFDDWVTIRAEHPHRAVLTHPFGDSEVILLLGARRVILEDLVITNVDPDYACEAVENNWLVHFQEVQEIIFRNNIVFGNRAAGACNNLLSINRSTGTFYPKDIQITGNLFYGAPDIGGASLIYLNIVGEIDVTDNIFFGHNSPQAYSFIELYKGADPSDGVEPRSPRMRFARNIFLNWQGVASAAFIQVGQSWDVTNTVSDVMIENNLMIGNSTASLVSPVQIRCGDTVTLRANTITGDLPSQAYGLHLYYEGIQVTKKDVALRNNIFSDPSGSMGDRLIDYRTDVIDPDTVGLVLDHNLYHNAGNPLPSLQAPAPGDDLNGVVADPGLAGDPTGLVLPVWDTENHSFPSGSTTIREEFERLVSAYGAIGEDSPAVGAADPAHMPAVDILGRQRDAQPDMGAFEWIGEQPDAGPGDGGTGEDGEPPPGRVVLRAGPLVPAGRVVTPADSQVILRFGLEAYDVQGALTGVRVQLPGLQGADSPYDRIQLALYTDPEGDGTLGSTSELVGGAWVGDGQALVQVGGLRFSPGDSQELLLQLSVNRLSASRAGWSLSVGLLLVLALLIPFLRKRPGLRLAIGLSLILVLLACTRYGFKPTRFEGRALIEAPGDVNVNPECSVELAEGSILGQLFKLSL